MSLERVRTYYLLVRRRGTQAWWNNINNTLFSTTPTYFGTITYNHIHTLHNIIIIMPPIKSHGMPKRSTETIDDHEKGLHVTIERG